MFKCSSSCIRRRPSRRQIDRRKFPISRRDSPAPSKGADKGFGRDATWLNVVPPAFGPPWSNSNRFDLSDPVVRLESPRSERRDHFEHLIGESPDVQDVRPLRSLRRLVRLDIQTNQASLRIPAPEFRPLGQQRSSQTTSLIHPRLVIRDEDNQVRFRLLLVQKTNRSAAVRAASTDRSQPSGVRLGGAADQVLVRSEPRAGGAGEGRGSLSASATSTVAIAARTI